MNEQPIEKDTKLLDILSQEFDRKGLNRFQDKLNINQTQAGLASHIAPGVTLKESKDKRSSHHESDFVKTSGGTFRPKGDNHRRRMSMEDYAKLSGTRQYQAIMSQMPSGTSLRSSSGQVIKASSSHVRVFEVNQVSEPDVETVVSASQHVKHRRASLKPFATNKNHVGRVVVDGNIWSQKDIETLMVDSEKVKELVTMSTRKSSTHMGHRHSNSSFINPREHNYTRLTDSIRPSSSLRPQVPLKQRNVATPSLLISQKHQMAI